MPKGQMIEFSLVIRMTTVQIRAGAYLRRIVSISIRFLMSIHDA